MACSFCPESQIKPTVEDSRNELRQLEHNALEAVLHAFRSQGPLDLYKEVLLDHLKSSLFISSDDYIFKVDHVATNKNLKRICETLNPSYASTNANWLLERQSILPADFCKHMDRLGRDVTDIFDPTQISDEDWKRMHQEHLAEKSSSLAKLLTLKKQPFTPECLREILVATEQTTRTDCKKLETSTQTCDNETNIPTILPIKQTTVDTQTPPEWMESVKYYGKTVEDPAFELMDTDKIKTRSLSESYSDKASSSGTTSTSTFSNSNHPSKTVLRLIKNLKSKEFIPFDKFMQKKLTTLKPTRSKNARSLNLKTRYHALRQISQQPELQLSHVVEERSHSLD